MFASKLQFEDDGGLPFTLLQPLKYFTHVIDLGPKKLATITAPTGFKTDLASIPRGLWNILPPVGKYDAAAVIHDYLYQRNGVTRAQADAILFEGMTCLRVSRWQRWAIYLGVRVGGWVVWNNYRRRK